MSSTIVVGLDGASTRLLQPWLDDGALPTLDRILTEGVSGDLESVLPPVTSPNWTCYSTGKNPGKVGVFWWHNVDVEGERVHLPTERYHAHDEYWELLAEDAPVGVVNVPTTYPPKALDGVVVAGPPDGRNEGFTQPPELEAELRDRFDYRVTKRLSLRNDGDEAYEEVLELIDSRFQVAKWLLEEWDLSFLQVTSFYINSLHHHRWDDEYVLRAWQLIDEYLADLLAPDRDLVLMSDHGHAEIESVFYVNEWLSREGYLEHDDALAERIYGLGINADRIERALEHVDRLVPPWLVPGRDLQAFAGEVTPQWVLDRLPDQEGELGGSKHGAVDWDRTEALASAQGPIYLTVDADDAQYEPLRSELIDRLESLTDDAGRPIADAVHRAEAVYSGPYVGEGPDIVLDKAEHVNVREELGGGEAFRAEDSAWNGVNRRDGLFAAVGPSFRSGSIEDISILDLAPTLLHLHGKAVPEDMDGTVRQTVFAPDSEPARRPVEYRSTAAPARR